MTDCRDQSAEEALAEKLVEVACALNKRCGMRASHSRAGLQEYSGFSVRLEGLRSAIYAPLQVFFGQAAYDSPFERAAALIVNIAQGHHFGDGNKRTALHLGLFYLSMLGINAGRQLRQWSDPTAAP
ncbi:Fic family protein [Corynebacterium propinquum]|nr:Fic family protein [Corynebacterium propinquum]MDK4239080.1 Fic family protein [Corynebacterium propinquum]MDK4302243.1 Fic family protein [Corynebacterium propinquum]MDK8666049.1 Fic family protein [Corynebacterium propinquum]MDK8721914.1 Fic family protein [Corynebacterium propinquum]RUP79431.1 hypothetical protein D8M24_03995 [Corynebacterium propinquum]